MVSLVQWLMFQFVLNNSPGVGWGGVRCCTGATLGCWVHGHWGGGLGCQRGKGCVRLGVQHWSEAVRCWGVECKERLIGCWVCCGVVSCGIGWCLGEMCWGSSVKYGWSGGMFRLGNSFLGSWLRIYILALSFSSCNVIECLGVSVSPFIKWD